MNCYDCNYLSTPFLSNGCIQPIFFWLRHKYTEHGQLYHSNWKKKTSLSIRFWFSIWVFRIPLTSLLDGILTLLSRHLLPATLQVWQQLCIFLVLMTFSKDLSLAFLSKLLRHLSLAFFYFCLSNFTYKLGKDFELLQTIVKP